YAQHLTASGDLAIGWPQGGLPVCTDPFHQSDPFVVRDQQGGWFVAWNDGRNIQAGWGFDLYVQRIRSDGTLAPGWAVDGMPATHALGSQELPFMAADGEGGVFLAWYTVDTYTVSAQHLTATGVPAPGWPANG